SISLSSPVTCTTPKEDVGGAPVPANVAALPEEHRSSLLGRRASGSERASWAGVSTWQTCTGGQSDLGAVVPVLFLNSGLGTPLLPHTLECADFKAALEAAEDESDKALLNKCQDSATRSLRRMHLSERNIIRASIRGRPVAAGGGAAEEEYTAGVRAALGERLDGLLDALVADHHAPPGHSGIPTR
ncbi:Uncharacterized protein OBRU01_23721, partial [Operophtera brumata]